MRFCFSCLPMRCRIVRKHNFFIHVRIAFSTRFRRRIGALLHRTGPRGDTTTTSDGCEASEAAERESRATSKI